MSDAAFAASTGTRNLGIDLLRIFALLLVLSYHYQGNHFLLSGLHGVVIFFMVSGYCMNFSMAGRRGVDFLKARFWRLTPTFMLCATLTALIEFLLPNVMPDRTQPLLSYPLNIFCLPHGMFACDLFGDVLLGRALPFPWIDGAYWSLLVEIRFYLLLWLLYYVLRVRYAALALAALGLLAPLNLATEYISKSQDFLLYLSFFSFGMGYSAAVRNEKYAYLTMAASFLVFTINSFSGSAGISLSLRPDLYVSFTLCFVIFCVVMLLFRHRHHRAISTAAILTYPIYLLHQDIGYISIELLGNSVSPDLRGILTAGFIILLAISVQTLVDRYGKALRAHAEHAAQLLIARYALKKR